MKSSGWVKTIFSNRVRRHEKLNCQAKCLNAKFYRPLNFPKLFMFCPKIIFGLGSISVSAERAEVVQHLCIYILNLSKRIHISPAFIISDDLTDKFQWPKSQQKENYYSFRGKGKVFWNTFPFYHLCLS